MGTCPHQVLAVTLTLSQPGGGADYAHPILVSTPSFERPQARLISVSPIDVCKIILAFHKVFYDAAENYLLSFESKVYKDLTNIILFFPVMDHDHHFWWNFWFVSLKWKAYIVWIKPIIWISLHHSSLNELFFWMTKARFKVDIKNRLICSMYPFLRNRKGPHRKDTSKNNQYRLFVRLQRVRYVRLIL